MVGRIDLREHRESADLALPIGFDQDVYGRYSQLRTASIVAECRYEAEKSPSNQSIFEQSKEEFRQYACSLGDDASMYSRHYDKTELPSVAREAGLSAQQVRRYMNLNDTHKRMESSVTHETSPMQKPKLIKSRDTAKNKFDCFVAALTEPQKTAAYTLSTHFADKVV